MQDLTARPTTDADLRYGQVLELAAQINRPELWRRVFRKIEDAGFLGDQVAHFARREQEERLRCQPQKRYRSKPGDIHFGLFEQAASDLERYLLPAAVELQDWERFLRYLLVAANLRGLAEALAEPEILEALARSGRLDFAREVASRLPTPEARARARCAIAAGLPEGVPAEDSGPLMLKLRADLETADSPQSPSEAETWCRVVEEAARTVPQDHRRKWSEWVGRLEPWPVFADRAWLALVEGLLREGETGRDSELWEAVAALKTPGAGLAAVESCLARTSVEDPWPLLGQVAHRLGGAAAGWRALVAVLRQRATEAGDLEPLWRQGLSRFGSPPWTAALVDAGGELWGRLPAPLVEEALAAIDDPAAAAALRIASWKPGEAPQAASQIRREVERISPGAERLRRYLDFLWASRQGPRGELRASLAGVSRYLNRVRYAAGERDLVRWLDLVAELEKQDLRREVESLLWSAAGSPGVLRALAETSASPALQEELLARAEAYAATVAVTEAEGFELRRELIVRLTCRRCREEGKLDGLEAAANRLLPEEENELRGALARELAEAGLPELAEEAATKIRDRRAQLLAHLQAYRRRPVPDELVAPLDLYGAVASIVTIEDELAALAALQEVPADPEAVAAAHLAGFNRRGRQIEGLVDLAWHALEDQRRRFPPRRQDRKAAILPLRQALGVVESQDWLLALAPELVELGSQLGPAECLAELQEGIEKVIQLDAAPWLTRAEALEAILASVPRLVAADWPGILPAHPARDRTAARLLRWLVELPDSLPVGPGREELRRNWHCVLPQMMAVLERLPERVRHYLAHPLRAWLCYEGLGGLAGLVGRERAWALLERLERLVPRALRRPLASSWAEPTLETFRGRWTWLTEGQEAGVRLCLAQSEERRRVAKVWLAGGASTQDIETLAYLLAKTDPKLCAELLARLPPGATRDALCRRLVRYEWLEPVAASRAAGLIGDEETRILASAWLPGGGKAEGGEAGWVSVVGEAIARAILAADDPANARLRHGLWHAEPQGTLPALAQAAIRSLEAGGKSGAEAAACWWLNARLAPTPGQAARDGWDRRLADLRAAAARALSLRGQRGRSRQPRRRVAADQEAGDGREDEAVAPGGAAEPKRARFDLIHATWRKVRERRPRALPWIESLRGTLDAASILVMIATAMGFLALDAVFEVRGGPVSPEARAVRGAVPWLLISGLVSGAQAILIDRFLKERFSGRGLLPRWWRWVRLGLAGIPLFGLYVIPGWQWLLARWESRVEAPPAPCFSLPSASSQRLWSTVVGSRAVVWAARRMSSGAGMATLFVIGFAAFYGFALALPGLRPSSGAGRLVVLLTVLLVHLASAAAAGVHLWLGAERLRLSRPGMWGLTALALFWLVPNQTAAFLGLVTYVFVLVLVPQPAERTLSGQALGGVAEARALPIWQRLLAGVEEFWRGVSGLRALRRQAGLRAARGEGGVESRLLLLCRGKAVLLFFEAAALAWALESSARATLLDARGVEAVLKALGAVSLFSGTVGLIAMGVGFARKVLRSEAEILPPRPFLASASYLAGTQLSACAGLHFGEAIAAGNRAETGGLLAFVGLVGAVLSIAPIILSLVLPIPPPSQHRERVWFFSTLGYCSVAFTGVGIARGQPGPWSSQALEQLLWFGPALSLMLGAAGLEWLRLALGGGGRTTAAGLRTRVERPWLVVPAVLPLGALAVPLWVLAWHRRRLWARKQLPVRRADGGSP